jgi:uroporphyrinogen decarboxylase
MSVTPMTKKERVRATLAGGPVDRPAVSLWGHDFLREWSVEDLVEQTVESYRRFDWDFIKLNPRWTFFAEAWGNEYEPPSEQKFPRLLTRVVKEPGDLSRINPVDPVSGVFGAHLEALSGVVQQTAPEVDVVYTLFSPLAVCSLLVGRLGAPLTEWARQDPAPVHAAIGAVAETLCAHATAALDRGASGLFFAPLQWTSRKICDDAFYGIFGRPYDLQVLAAVAAADFNILHVCGDDNRIDELLDYPVAAFNWDDHGEGNPPLAALQARTDKAVMGGVSRTRLGDLEPEEVTAHVNEAVEGCRRPVFVTGGCGISPLVSAQTRAAVRRAAVSPPSR